MSNKKPSCEFYRELCISAKHINNIVFDFRKKYFNKSLDFNEPKFETRFSWICKN